ncbi:MAG TPA: hypothetical protein VF378_14830 [Geothrix sp.]
MQVGSVQAETTNLIVQPAKTANRGYYDPADTNKDGVVSAAEALAYSLTHPQLGVHKAASSAPTHTAQASTVHPPAAYTQRATMNRTSQFQHGLLDLKA